MAVSTPMTREERVDVLARVTHDANRAWCEVHGDHSQPEWDEAPDWQTSSARDGVEFALAGASPEELHENWSALKIREGWTYGEVKDPEAKTHPCLVPYDQLPEQQRTKDALFHAVVAALAPALDLLPKGVTLNGGVTPGQATFLAYCAAVEQKTHDGSPIPPWEELTDAVRAGWEAAAQEYPAKPREA